MLVRLAISVLCSMWSQASNNVWLWLYFGERLRFSISSCLSIIRDIFYYCVFLYLYGVTQMRLFVCFICLFKFFIHICGNLIFLATWHELPNDFENSSKSNSSKSLMVIEVEDYQARCLLDVCFTLQLLLPNINSFCKF